MKNDTANAVTLSPVAQSLLRILIASYFLASSLRLIPGTDLSPLLRSVLPDPHAGATAAAIVFVLAFLVMIGVWTRAAAMVLALMTFFASYLRMVELDLVAELGAFWRDLALIAALMLSYSDNATGGQRSFGPIRLTVKPRRVAADPATRAKRREEARARIAKRRAAQEEAAAAPPLPADEAAMMDLFREDLTRVIAPGRR